MAALTDFKCPCCGGAIEFNSNVQKMKCPYCDSEFDVEALQSDAASESEKPDNIEWGNDGVQFKEDEASGMKIYICNSCGGEIVADENTAATSCPFCDSPIVIKGQVSDELKPDLIIPFKIDKKAAKEALQKHISTKKFIPKIFKDENHIDEIRGIYVPYWLFNCLAQGTASFDAQTIHTWSDSKYNYTKTSHYRVMRSGKIEIDSLPVDGSSKMEDNLMESIEPFDKSEAVDFNTAYLAGYLADKYDVDAQESITRANERIKASLNESLRETISDHYSTVSCESSSMNVDNGTYKYALYPVWILNTSWKDEKFVFAVNGQTGKIVGDLPLDKSAFRKWTAILTAGIGAIAYGIMWLTGFLG